MGEIGEVTTLVSSQSTTSLKTDKTQKQVRKPLPLREREHAEPGQKGRVYCEKSLVITHHSELP